MSEIKLRMDPIRVETRADYASSARLTIDLTPIRTDRGPTKGDVVTVDMAFANGREIPVDPNASIFSAEDARQKAIRLLHEALHSLERWKPDLPT